MPSSANVFYYRAKMMIRDYTEEFGFAPTDKEVAEFMGCSLNMYQTLMNTYRGTLSLDAGRIPGDPDSPSLGESIQDMNIQDPGEAIDRDKMMVILRQALASLTPREEKIIRLRFGLGEEPTNDQDFPITQDEIEVLNARQGGV
jgi:RNA polymerase primary sigma factor